MTDSAAPLPIPDALLFDLDGVLADVSGSYRVAVMRTAEHFGATILRREISEAKAIGNANNDWELTTRLLRARGVDVSLAEVTRVFEEIYQGTPGTPGLRATERLIGSRALMDRFAARLPLAIVTGRPRRDAEIFLRDHGIIDVFRAIVCMEDATPVKPHPAPVLEAMRRLAVSRPWMLGDTVDDIRAARGAGIVALGIVAPGEDPDAVVPNHLAAGASRVLRAPEELEGLLATCR